MQGFLLPQVLRFSVFPRLVFQPPVDSFSLTPITTTNLSNTFPLVLFANVWNPRVLSETLAGCYGVLLTLTFPTKQKASSSPKTGSELPLSALDTLNRVCSRYSINVCEREDSGKEGEKGGGEINIRAWELIPHNHFWSKCQVKKEWSPRTTSFLLRHLLALGKNRKIIVHIFLCEN